MCVLSMVMDEFGKHPDWQLVPTNPPIYPFVTNPGAITFTPQQLTKADIDKLEQLVKDFKEAVQIAEKLDILLKKPDCVDPEKHKLVQRVAELEDQLNKIKQITNP